MPKIPYIPQATPITVTIDGHWDGMHNGNEPYMTYPGHEGSPRAVHIPHGALVQTRVEEVEFTVDKTPKHPHDYSDVTDTGEPLDAGKLGHMTFDGPEVEDPRPDCGARCPSRTYECDRPAGHDGSHQNGWLGWGQDTTRKPEPGDRVPKIGDTVAVPLNDENGTIIVGSLVATYDDKFWIEGDDFDLQVPHQGSRVTVIEPARPAVPDEPEGVERVLTQNHRVAMLTGGGWIVIGNPDDDPDDREPMTYDWQALWHYHGPLYIYSRGPVVGG
jgi:hypothetical protein